MKPLLLKKCLCIAPILRYPDPNLPSILDTDTSNIGIGFVLSQVGAKGEQVVAYGSLSLNKSEKNYCATRKELLVLYSV